MACGRLSSTKLWSWPSGVDGRHSELLPPELDQKHPIPLSFPLFCPEIYLGRICGSFILRLPQSSIPRFLTSCQWDCTDGPIPPKLINNMFSTTCAWSITSLWIRIGAGRTMERNERSYLSCQCKKTFEPHIVTSASLAALLGENVYGISWAERYLKHKLNKMRFSQIDNVEESNTETLQKKKNIGSANDEQDKPESFISTLREKTLGWGKQGHEGRDLTFQQKFQWISPSPSQRKIGDTVQSSLPTGYMPLWQPVSNVEKWSWPLYAKLRIYILMVRSIGMELSRHFYKLLRYLGIFFLPHHKNWRFVIPSCDSLVGQFWAIDRWAGHGNRGKKSGEKPRGLRNSATDDIHGS